MIITTISRDSSRFKVNHVHLPLFPRLFQVIVRIDDCLALLNLVSRVGDVSVTLRADVTGGCDGAKREISFLFLLFLASF